MSVQKFKPVFDQGNLTRESVPFTQLCNKTIQNCTNMEVIGMWAYLQSMPSQWILNPDHLKKHFKIGKNKVYKILSYMIEAKLLVRHVHISAKGTRIKTTYTVLNGVEFIDPSGPVEDFAPLPQNPEMDNPEMDNRDYIKERVLENKKESKKEIYKSLSATDVAQATKDDSFDSFWKLYPVKKNKERAQKIWKRKKYGGLLDIILADIMNRLANCSQWADKQYIPHPSTYLNNQLWNDEVTLPTTKRQSGDSFNKFLKQQRNKGETYDQHGNTYDPFR